VRHEVANAFRSCDDDSVINVRALKMLRDCHCVRASGCNPGLSVLVITDLASASEVAGEPELFDFRLTDEGKKVARRLLRRV
jgi:hypothetical protein